MHFSDKPQLSHSLRLLSPKRNTTQASNIEELISEQLTHFGIDPSTPFGKSLTQIVRGLYESQAGIDDLWKITIESMATLETKDRIARFNAKKFLSFQLAKLIDTLQHPFRKSYQSLNYSPGTLAAKGPYPIFDNVTALFSATPVIARTATYIYACAEWVEDAFKGQELLLEIYSRLMNPTSTSLANQIVDLECGPYADQYFAWNFGSGMAAIDCTLAHLLGREDILITNRNIYGGAYQLIHDWYAKPSNLSIAVESFDGYRATDLEVCLTRAKREYRDRLKAGRRIYLYLESPSNPHGDFLDVPGLCELAHRENIRVVLDATIGTPFLYKPFQREDPVERPDFVIHSYTNDLTGTGSAIAGVAIGRNEDMFIPKGSTANGISWENTMFWNVYYVKGAFLNADAAFVVILGMRTLEMRMLPKCLNTLILARFLDAHPRIHVRSNALKQDPNFELREELAFLQLPSPLMTIRFQDVDRDAFQRFFDCLAPTFGHMISLGQSNTIVSCPALTTHSEMDEDALRQANIDPTTIRIALGDEDSRDLIVHFIEASRLTLDPVHPGFSDAFMSVDEINALIEETSMDVQRKYVQSKLIPASVQQPRP
ncbi:MAG: PLP-dependent transferase [Gammaproteobacteria bacterium]|nr:PLP-dependent transferase [Gammaproteobacteria bacterium]